MRERKVGMRAYVRLSGDGLPGGLTIPSALRATRQPPSVVTSVAADSMGWLMNLSYPPCQPPATCTTRQASAKPSQGYTRVDQHDERVIAICYTAFAAVFRLSNERFLPDIEVNRIKDIFVKYPRHCK